MSSRRTLILIAAIAVGALAAFAIFNYVGGIEDRASQDVERVTHLFRERELDNLVLEVVARFGLEALVTSLARATC